VIRRIDPGAVARLWRADVPGPVDVINLLRIEHLESYRWYGVLVQPPLLLVGGGPFWMGRLERALHGEAPADKLMLVRYPSHRRFLAMTLNPYYFAINALREHGVERFEASFTHASVRDPALGRRKRVLGVHFDGPLERLEALGEQRVGPLVYAARETAEIDVLDPPHPSDPNPLARKAFALFALGEGDVPTEATIEALAAATDGCEIALYRREPAAAFRPGARSGPAAPRTPQDTSLRSSSAEPAARNSTA
jgi:uncharacterized protein (DUF1330 family)